MDSFYTFYTASNIMFNTIPVIVTIGFIFVFGCMIVSIIKGASEWSNNNKQPVLDINCKVISKRIDVTRHVGHHDANGNYVGVGSSTSYYATFEFESKDRMEFKINGSQYGMLIEGDCGKLKFQGTRFLDFTRQ